MLGCLLEKQRTTPDAYPLSLNALRLACNQSTNRDPVVDYDDALLRDALHRLERRGLVRLASGAGSRAAKYRHLLAEALPMDSAEQAIMCVLMLRGPQTPGELKQRGERMHRVRRSGRGQRHARAPDRARAGARLPRRPGHKEERYAQLLREDADARVAGRGCRRGDLAAPAIGAAERGSAAAPAAVGAVSPEDAAVRALQELSSASGGWSASWPSCVRAWHPAGSGACVMSHAALLLTPPRIPRPAWASRSRSPPAWCRFCRRACCRSCRATCRR